MSYRYINIDICIHSYYRHTW